MPLLSPDQLRTRRRVESLIRLMTPALDAVLAVGDRISRIVEPEDVDDNPNSLLFGLSFASSLAVAFLYVMLPLRARRVGLLSPFMSILGVVAGALLVLQIVPPVSVVLQSFWLAAIGVLYLGKWPGGRGPAWDSGEAEPWPSAAERRGLTARSEQTETEDEAEEAAPEASEPERERRPSRKRKRKRR